MTQPTSTDGPSPATEIAYIAERLRAVLRLIEATPTDRPADQKALIWMLVEELAGLVSRAWRWAR